MEYNKLIEKYAYYKRQNLALDMSRGKPSEEQLALSEKLLDLKIPSPFTAQNFDIRNYGCLEGLLETRLLFSNLLNIDKDNILLGSNSTLNTIYDCITRLYIWGDLKNKPWKDYKKVKFICPCPGYDRHFAILEKFNIEMIPVSIKQDGLNMDEIEKLVLEDEQIKGIICVPKYSNPTGTCYNEETVTRLAKMPTKAKDFKIFWDNAYEFHYIYKKVPLLNILEECKKYNTEDRVLYFFSTSKMNFPGSGIAILAGSQNTIKAAKKHMSVQTIGYDKINQLKTTLFLKNKQNVLNLMDEHAKILKKRFDIVLNKLEDNFKNTNLLKFTKPLGGYFISVETKNNCAKRVVEICKELGVTLTSAGSTYPKNLDKNDSNIRLAPSYPALDKLAIAIDVFCLAVKIASLENKKTL